MGKLGTYDIETELGRGSMGVVYLAHDPCLQRRVALKTIHVPEGVDRTEIDSFRERFLREAQAAGSISHPGIVTIYGVDECPEEVLPFIAMEYVAGPNLRQILKQDRVLDPQRAFRIADALADALHTAHAAGVIHRDIKPANVLVRDSDGAVKIADFGVAHLALNELTRSGELVGSPAYMAPEQIRCGDANQCSDLFSLGVMLYEMLAGVRPFAGQDMAEIIHQVVYQEPVPITQVVEGLPGVINAFFDRALAKSPRDRFQDGAEFRQALNDVQLEYQISCTNGVASEPRMSLTESLPRNEAPAEEAPDADRNRLRQYLVFVALFAIFLLGWAFWGPSDDPVTAEQLTDPAAAPAELVAAGGVAGVAGVGTLTPDSIPAPADESELGESILTEDETLGAVDPEPPPTVAPKPVQKRRATPPKPKPAPVLTPEPEITEVPAALANAEAIAAEEATPTDNSDTATAIVPEPAQLTLVTRSALKVGLMTLFIDGEETLSLDLASGNRAVTRFYKKALRRGSRSEAGVLDLTPGPHEIFVRVSRPDKDKVREASIEVDLAEGETRTLEIVAGRLFGSGLVLRLQ